MSEWTDYYNGRFDGYVKKNPEVRKVLDNRDLGDGKVLRAVALTNGAGEVRLIVNGKVTKKVPAKNGTEAVKKYREIRNNLVPNYGTIAPASINAPIAEKATKKGTAKKGTAKK